MKRQPGISRLLLLVSLAVAVPRAVPGIETNAVEMAAAPPAVIRCKGYDIHLPQPKYVRVQMHEPFQGKPEAAREDIEEPKGGIRRWGGEQWAPGRVDGMLPSPAPVVRTSADDRKDRRLSASLEDVGTPDSETDANDTEQENLGWLAEGVSSLERAARREDKVRREADADRAWVDAFGIGERADLYVPGKSVFDRDRAGERNALYTRPATHSLWSSQPEPEKPVTPFVWSPPRE